MASKNCSDFFSICLKGFLHVRSFIFLHKIFNLNCPGGDNRGRLHGGVRATGEERSQPLPGDCQDVPQYPPGCQHLRHQT